MSQTDPAPADPHQENPLAAAEEQNKQIRFVLTAPDDAPSQQPAVEDG